MELKPGMSALVTGGASGIGKALCFALAKEGIHVTVVDYSEEEGQEVAFSIGKEIEKFYPGLKFPSSIFVRCNVTNAGDISAAFKKHLEAYGGLDICINNAGIGTNVPFHKDDSDGNSTWRRAVDVNLIAVIDCTRHAIKAMRSTKKHGVIINLGSGSAFSPLYTDPVYSATKGGVVMLTRSLYPLMHEGIRVNALCPEFVRTNLTSAVSSRLIESLGGFIKMEAVVDGAFKLIKDESKAGACLFISNRRGMEYIPSLTEEKRKILPSYNVKGSFIHHGATNINLPHSYEKIVVHSLDHNFRAATKIVPSQLSLPIKPGHALVKVLYAGVNASDVNFSSGRYFSGGKEDITQRLPFDAGFEAVGLIAAVGESVHLKVGTPVALMTFGSYAEFTVVPVKRLLPVPRPDPEVVAMLTSGLTASIALERAGQMESGQVVLVTAAAGGTGQFAVQLARLAGNKVVATCGGESKASLLKSLGVDRVIDYKKENIKAVLKKEFPKGVDIIYESVGGEMFDLCLNALAVYGRLIVIGMISQYQGEHGWEPRNYTGLCEKILAKSQTVAGFFLVQYAHLWQQHLNKLFDLFSTGKLKVVVDPKKFLGLKSVADAVEYLHSGQSHGKGLSV